MSMRPGFRGVLATVALLLPLLLAASEPVKPPELPIVAYRLPNGLKVVLSRDATVPRVTVCVAYHVGSKNESAGRTGFAHFFEHMMFRGTKHVTNYDIPLQEAGAQSNAFTNEDMTVYFETVPANFLERALYLEAERAGFLASALDQNKFDTEREVVKNERRQSYENRPYGLAEETLLAHVFPKGHPYSWSVIGSMKDLNNASLKDLKQFFSEFYHPANATLSLVGDFEIEPTQKLIEKYFGALGSGPEPKPVKAPEVHAVAERLKMTDRVQLPRVYWAWPTVADDHPDAPPLHLLASILAGGEASRLYRALVLDKQIASDVNASSDTKEISGLFTIDALTVQGHTPGEIEKAMTEELDKIRSAPPTADELKRSQAKFEKSEFSLLTNPLMRAVTLAAGFAEHNDPAYYKRDFERYFKVTPPDITRVAKKYLAPEKVVLEIHPAKPGEKESEAVQAGPLAAGTGNPPAPAERAPKESVEWSRIPGPSEPHPFRAPRIVRKRLSSGLDVWVVAWRTLPVVGARLLVPVGTADDPAGKSGLATLTATLLDKGTPDKTATELAEALELLGTSLSVSAGADTTSVGFSVVTRNLEPVLSLVGPMLATPRFDPKDVSRERQLQLEELLRGPDDAHWIARRAFRVLLYGPKHPYGNPADGFPDTVKSLSEDDIRAFHRARFAANRSTLIVVGDVDADALVKMLERTLTVWKTQGPAPLPRPEAEAHAKPHTIYMADKPEAVQSVIEVGRRWVSRDDPRYFATMVGNRILGGEFLSRLNQNLREDHGYTYGAGSVFNYRRTGSVWAVNSDVRADVTADALKEVEGELAGLAGKKPFTGEEFNTARTAEARAYPESFEDPGNIVGQLSEMAIFHLPDDYLDNYLDRLNATSAAEVQKAMAEVVDPQERTVLVVGDRKNVTEMLKKRGFDQIEVVTPDGLPATPAR